MILTLLLSVILSSFSYPWPFVSLKKTFVYLGLFPPACLKRFVFSYLRPGSSHGRGGRRECREDVCARLLSSARRGVGAVTRVP
jgi:hypothetical protein